MDLFVYGTLLSPDMMAAVAGPGALSMAPAVLPGYAVRPIQDNVVPFITAEESAQAMGAVWRGLTPDQKARLDAYEGAFGYELTPVIALKDGQEVTCQCYMPPAGIRAGAGVWSLEDWKKTHLIPAVLTAEELFSHDPLPDPAALRRMWPMIEGRAWAKYRAEQGAPTTLRREAVSDDVTLLDVSPPQGGFYRLQGLQLRHRRFAGDQSPVLMREAFFGVDAALVLPYDRTRGTVGFVEQFRVGPTARRDPNPWMLEPIAGIVDARETPEAAAIREAREEAGLDIRHLAPAGRYYPSPGSSTDYFYAFVGLCDLPEASGYAGGLPEEGEDLRIHTLPLEQAMTLAETGEIAAGPLLHLLYWLAVHRESLTGVEL